MLIGIAANGLHSNGFSLVRRILDEGVAPGKFDLRDAPPELNTVARERAARADAHLREAGAEPDARLHAQRPRPRHRRRLRRQRAARPAEGRARAHRPARLAAPADLRLPASATARSPRRRCCRVFNCGIGMVLVVPREQAEDVLERLEGMGERAYEIGVIERKPDDAAPLLFEDAPERRADGARAAADASLRARRWDVVVLGGALAGPRRGGAPRQAGARVLVVEEDEAARHAASCASPSSCPGSRRRRARRAACARSACRRSSGATSSTDPVAYQVLLPTRASTSGRPDRRPRSWSRWGLAKPEAARRAASSAIADGRPRRAERASLRSSAIRRGGLARPRARRAARRGRQPRGCPSALAQPPPALAPLLDARMRALANLANARAAARGARAAARRAARGRRAASRGPTRGLRALVRRRLEPLHGEFRALAGPSSSSRSTTTRASRASRQHDAWLGRALVLNAPLGRLARPCAAASARRRAGSTRPAPTARDVRRPRARAARAVPEPMPAAPCSRPRRRARQRRRRSRCSRSPPTRGPAVRRAGRAARRSPPTHDAARAAEDASPAGSAACCPSRATAVRARERLPRPLWDDDARARDPARPAAGRTGSSCALSRRAVFPLAREDVAALGAEGDLLLGWRAGDTILRGSFLTLPPFAPPGDSTTSRTRRDRARARSSLRAYWRLLRYVRPYVGVLAPRRRAAPPSTPARATRAPGC